MYNIYVHWYLLFFIKMLLKVYINIVLNVTKSIHFLSENLSFNFVLKNKILKKLPFYIKGHSFLFIGRNISTSYQAMFG